ncbi:hypothetical protein LEP1GSC133_2017 [Leptospira borgpetersenii serovar Pomona str. 200901868]|uniref:Uncharacterized protein n=1 Tax=Leptospira borgpetersenii serovar Pomona str. 200901868 TaxID=1192866 RepID=M6WJF7_LEPBO|nr:hypothetical protein LEP1GSC133_2017 [Leptospira borgpetersenii serovar Pomona str. 200901868]
MRKVLFKADRIEYSSRVKPSIEPYSLIEVVERSPMYPILLARNRICGLK